MKRDNYDKRILIKKKIRERKRTKRISLEVMTIVLLGFKRESFLRRERKRIVKVERRH